MEWPIVVDENLRVQGEILHEIAKELKARGMSNAERGDHRMLRVHLMLEELAELTVAMAKCDKLNALDGVADLQYVLSGTAHIMQLKLDEAFDEVHRSNMTKPVSDIRCTNKEGYEPADLSGLL
jgi:predicted HAD superfamily Cof-like phosphohydrolase